MLTVNADCLFSTSFQAFRHLKCRCPILKLRKMQEAINAPFAEHAHLAMLTQRSRNTERVGEITDENN